MEQHIKVYDGVNPEAIGYFLLRPDERPEFILAGDLLFQLVKRNSKVTGNDYYILVDNFEQVILHEYENT